MNEQNTLTPFGGQKQQSGGMIEVASSRAANEVQAALVIAKKFPRDENAAFERIIKACQRKSLAAVASYDYSRGGTQITGPSIDLLEVIAQNWGNMQSGVVELEQKEGETVMEAFAWDFETNYRDSKTFTVKHWRDTKQGGYALKESRDIYESNANFAARRKRACMEGVIPRWVVDSATSQCEKTLAAGHTEPIADRVRAMVLKFGEYQISVAMLEKRVQHKLDACNEAELIRLGKIYNSLKAGVSKREDHFEVEIQSPKFKSDEKAESAAGLAPSAPAPAPAPPITGGSPANPTPAAENPREIFRRKLVEHGIAGDGFIAYALSKELIRTAPPENEPDRLGVALAGIHGKTVNRLIAEIESIVKWVVESRPPVPAPAIGEMSQPQKDLLTRIQEAGITVGQFLTWSNDTGQTDEATDLREVPDARCLAILKAWDKIEAQIKLIPV